MKPRSDVVEMFASFLSFKDKESSTVWISQSALRRSMTKRFQSSDNAPQDGNFWALYWHQIWCKKPQNIAKDHLCAYLQETAYKGAWDVAKKLDPAKRWDKVQEYFQISFKNKVYERVLQRFNSQYGSQLEAFALPLFKNSIKEELRRGNKAASHGNWSLLRHSSNKVWVKALQLRGLSISETESYLLLKDCYNALYLTTNAKTNRELPPPNTETLEAITRLYNKERLSQLADGGTSLTSQDIQTKLKETALAIRNYQNPQEVSLNARLGTEEGSEFQDILPSNKSDSLLDDLIARQEQLTETNLQASINSILEKALTEKIKPEAKKYLQLLYTDELTQMEIAERVLGDKNKQYKVSRSINSAVKQLLKALTIWAKNRETHNFDPDNIVDTIDIFLKEWLKNYYAKLRN